MNEKRIYVNTFGCQQNEADSETLTGIAQTRGFIPTEKIEEADLILFNTCAVREHAELKALSTTGQLKHLKEKNKALKIGLCGCMVQQEHRKEDIKNKYPYVDFVFGTNQLSRFGEILDQALAAKKRLFFVEDYAVNPGTICEGLPVKRKYAHRAYVSVMYGCNNFCTYCIVPYVRGRERSREPQCIYNEVKGLVENGCREITLLGQNVNSYGKDLETPFPFSELLEMLDGIEGDFVLKFMTSHPKDASFELIDTIAKCKHVEHHFHLPMQAGSDSILKAMNRRYTAERYFELVDYMKKKIPDIAITTDIIVGFPGETEEDFEKTLDALRHCRFDGVFSFIYSPRKGTPAAEMDCRVPDEVTRSRMSRLLELQMQIQTENNEKLVGKTLRALCEGESKNDPDYLSARSDSGKLIHFPKPEKEIQTGEIVTLRVTEARAIMLIGEIAV
ncbi:MAG: tRNA (N6-isopentenyl adenosine(37)-C2)-methylthiotransferase MiaB [Ruminococcaceae bacterium]|nr:tRNA (N6-isopentenyl adenosine(37)-C2)-methylthiotransferase MiaB [Oscillospiraceae bacterium]